MKPGDASGRLPLDKRPFRVLVISGSQRRQYNCPGVDSKSRMLMLRMADRLPQCRYGGVEAPDSLWRHAEFGAGKPYADNQAEHLAGDEKTLHELDAWRDAFAAFVAAKGKVPAGKYRAFGYKAPRHRLADLRLKWRELRISAGLAPAGSSPARQAKRGLNRDRTFRPKVAEGRKLRRK